jgi:hypothetical protein
MTSLDLVQAFSCAAAFAIFGYRAMEYMHIKTTCKCVSIAYLLTILACMTLGLMPWEAVFGGPPVPASHATALASFALFSLALSSRRSWADGLPDFYRKKPSTTPHEVKDDIN